MGLFSGLKIRKLIKNIEKYPDQYRNYHELVSLLLEEKNRSEALEWINRGLLQPFKADEKTWLKLQSLNIHLQETPDFSVFQQALALALDRTSDFISRAKAAIICSKLFETLKENNDEISEKILGSIPELEAVESRISDLDDKIQLGLFISELYLIQGNYVDSLGKIDALIQDAEKNRHKQIASIYLKAGRLAVQLDGGAKKVRAYFQKAIDSGRLTESETIEALYHLAQALHQADDLLGAMEKYETALRFAGSKQTLLSVKLRFNLAKIYMEVGRIPQAYKETDLSLAGPVAQGDLRAQILLWRSRTEQVQSKLVEAMNHVQEAREHVETPSLKIDILTTQAEIADELQDYEAAVSCLSEALAIPEANDDMMLQFKLACAFSRSGLSHKSLKLLNSLKTETAYEKIGQEQILFEEAFALQNQLKILRALESYLAILENFPEDNPVYDKTKKTVQQLKRELETPEGIKKYKIDGSDRKHLATLLARSPEEEDFFARLKKGLAKTKAGLIGGIEKILSGKTTIDESVIDDLEELLILSDLGVETTQRIIQGLRDRFRKKELSEAEKVRGYIKHEIEQILSDSSGTIDPDTVSEKPYVIMVVGVNGVGKTTTIAKIAKRFKDQGKLVMLAAGDTFRAGAIEQLQEWGRRIDVEVISQKEGADPSAVAWDAVAAAKNKKADILVVDTAGRLHTKNNLMEELKKVHRVIGKNMPGAPHEILLVLDATTGQNAIIQAKLFKEAADVSGIALTKLDGTAKGGIIVGIVEALKLPVKLIGIGERMDDLRDFDPKAFASALFEE